jgi:hypothetical protein
MPASEPEHETRTVNGIDSVTFRDFRPAALQQPLSLGIEDSLLGPVMLAVPSFFNAATLRTNRSARASFYAQARALLVSHWQSIPTPRSS